MDGTRCVGQTGRYATAALLCKSLWSLRLEQLFPGGLLRQHLHYSDRAGREKQLSPPHTTTLWLRPRGSETGRHEGQGLPPSHQSAPFPGTSAPGLRGSGLPKHTPHLDARVRDPRTPWLSLLLSHSPSTAQLQKKGKSSKGAGQIITVATLLLLIITVFLRLL